MKKTKWMILAAAMAVCLSFTGCGGGDGGGQDGAGTIDGAALAEALAGGVAFEDQLTQVDQETALMLYGVAPEQVASAVVYVGTGATAEEIAVFEGVDEAAADAIEAQAEARLASQLSDYADYKPDEVPKLENPVLETEGNYVILCVSGDNETAESIIDGMTN